MAAEVQLVVRFERMPDLGELKRAIEDAFDDAVVLEWDVEEDV